MNAPAPPPVPDHVVYEKTEYEDPPEEKAKKMRQLVDIVRSAQNLVVYTGAGVSTACGIPDFRGDNGMDKYGWQSAVLGMGVGKGAADLLMPSYSHVAITKLLNEDVVKFVVSSNHDNLHIRSGASPDKVSEIFGNGYIETCLKCGDKFLRHTQVPQLGRICDHEECGGRLKKEGVRFGGMVPEGPLRIATNEAKKADVALVLGSSMSVSPFCNLPWKAKKVIIVCLQDTTVDRRATIKINATCDEVMHGILEGLGRDSTLEYEYRQSFLVSHRREADGGWALRLGGGRKNEVCTCVEEVRVTLPGQQQDEPRLMDEGDGVWDLAFEQTDASAEEVAVEMEIVFRPAYGVPPRQLRYVIRPSEGDTGQQLLRFSCHVHYPVPGQKST